MDSQVRQKDKERTEIEAKLQKGRQDYEPYRAQEELNLIHVLFPMMKEQLRIAGFCKKFGLAVENISLKIEKEPDNPNMLQLNIDGMNILEWFRKKYREFQSVGIRARQEPRKDRGMKMK